MSARVQLTHSSRGVRFDVPRLDGLLITAAVSFFGLLFLALFGDRIAPHEPIYFVVEHGSDPRPYDPGIVFPFGSDVLGRDIVSLVLTGAGTTLSIVCIGGVARVTTGVLLAAAGSWWRPVRLATESVAELVSAIPATLVALVIVKILVRADTTVFVFVGALLVIGWAGPYRVVRAEIDRLAHAPFTIGAHALGVSSWRIFWRHQLPHLVPVLAVNLAQQVVASLVLVAELGVLGTFVGTTRLINIEESLTRVITGPVNRAQIADPPEWGGLLAGARTIESLWTTRWLIVIPGVAFAVTAAAVAAIGFALARRFAQRDIFDDLRGSGAAALALATILIIVVAGLVPERYAAARDWAAAARAGVAQAPGTQAAFARAGLAPLASSYAIEQDVANIVQTGGATVRVGGAAVAETWPHDTTRIAFADDLRAVVNGFSGGGVIEAPLVFAGRGIVPSEGLPVARTPFGQLPDLNTLIKDYADDYAGIEVRGKVVLLARFFGFLHRTLDANGAVKSQRFVFGPGVEDSIAGAIKRGAAAVLLVDPNLPLYTATIRQGTSAGGGTLDPYPRIEQESPATTTQGPPVVVLSGKAAASLATPLGLDLTPFMGFDEYGAFDGKASASRELGVTARVEVPLARQESRSTSYLAEVPNVPQQIPRVLVWSIRDADQTRDPAPATDAVAELLGSRAAPFIFVDFDPTIDPRTSTRIVREAIGSRPIGLVVVLQGLVGKRLRFRSPSGELIPAFDLYAARAGARAAVTRDTAAIAELSNIAPFIDVRTILVTGDGDGVGDLRADAAAVLGYLAGRLALGAEELPR